MNKREELVDKLSEIKKEFVGFPEEQTINEAIDELSTNDSRVNLPSLEEPVRVTDLLLMARTLGAFCNNRPCTGCVFNDEDLGCSIGFTWRRKIDVELLKKHVGEKVTFIRDEEE